MTRTDRRFATVIIPLTVTALLAGCGNSGSSGSADAASDAGPLTLYNAQHEDLITAMVDGFTEQTGIEVELRSGDDAELANQIVAEGDASPADVFVTENSPSIDLVAEAGLLAPIEESTLAQVPDQFSPADGSWVGFAARSTVLAYNTDKLTEAQLPASLLDLADPAWKGRFGIAPGGADFQAIVGAVLALRGEDATRTWLAGLKDNAQVYQGNTAVMTAVDQGEIEAGVIYHYYWYKDRAESGNNSANVELHYFGNQDPGAFVSVSGAGVLASSDQADEAQQLVAYLTSPAGQQRSAQSTALEYAVGNDATSAEVLPPLDGLDAPEVDPGMLNGPQVTELMQEAGLL
ncbi:iron(III) transport system substrate-binding protein [Modestobacter sp. DSM 44400]|nr:iron ABC transporter substrate-binding protein [Modestobacter sp. DSM 44400]SDY13397.1 iron(III) transport system substrate-binding protein [Modestobacter sp. DSM 44400]